DRVHQQFIDIVKKGRGERLKSDPGLFTGLVWSGEQSLNLGLIDALGSSGFVAREVIGVENIVDFTHREHYFDRWAKQLSAAAAKAFMNPIPALR
ncbi:MAG: S49 family peptidase, partial [Gammaproteobacteria bacterium]